MSIQRTSGTKPQDVHLSSNPSLREEAYRDWAKRHGMSKRKRVPDYDEFRNCEGCVARSSIPAPPDAIATSAEPVPRDGHRRTMTAAVSPDTHSQRLSRSLEQASSPHHSPRRRDSSAPSSFRRTIMSPQPECASTPSMAGRNYQTSASAPPSAWTSPRSSAEHPPILKTRKSHYLKSRPSIDLALQGQEHAQPKSLKHKGTFSRLRSLSVSLFVGDSSK